MYLKDDIVNSIQNESLYHPFLLIRKHYYLHNCLQVV